jgi:hypothetical protein
MPAVSVASPVGRRSIFATSIEHVIACGSFDRCSRSAEVSAWRVAGLYFSHAGMLIARFQADDEKSKAKVTP